MIVQDFDRSKIAEAWQPCPVVSVDEASDELVSFVMGVELVFSAVALCGRCASNGFRQTPVEPLHQAVCLRMIGFDEPVRDGVSGAGAVKRMLSRGLSFGFSFHVDGEAVGKLRAVVGEDGVNRMAEGLQKSLQAGGDGLGIPAHDDFDIDEPRRPLDGDEDIRRLAPEPGEMLEIDMHETKAGVGEAARLVGRRLLRPARQPMPFQAAIDGAARQRVIHTAAHDLNNIIKAEAHIAAKPADQRFFRKRRALAEAMTFMRAVMNILASAPAPHRGLRNAEFRRSFSRGMLACLNILTRPRRRRRIGVKANLHEILALQEILRQTKHRFYRNNHTK